MYIYIYIERENDVDIDVYMHIYTCIYINRGSPVLPRRYLAESAAPRSSSQSSKRAWRLSR